MPDNSYEQMVINMSLFSGVLTLGGQLELSACVRRDY